MKENGAWKGKNNGKSNLVQNKCAIFTKTSKDEYGQPWLWHHQRDQINCVVINECHSKQGVW